MENNKICLMLMSVIYMWTCDNSEQIWLDQVNIYLVRINKLYGRDDKKQQYKLYVLITCRHACARLLHYYAQELNAI